MRITKTKLLLTVGVPFIALAYFSSSVLIDKGEQWREALILERLVYLVSDFSKVIHGIQIERGLTCGYLGSQGEKYSENLIAHYVDIAPTISSLNNKLEAIIEQGNGLIGLIKPQILELETIIEEHDFMRMQVRTFSIGCNEVFDWYSLINGKMIHLVHKMSTMVDNRIMNSKLLSYQHFLQAKELMGKERGLVNGSLSRGEFSPRHFERFIESHAQQKHAFNMFKRFASADELEVYNALIDPGIQEKLDQMRLVIREGIGRENRSFNIEAEQWFKLASENLDQLLQVENHFLEVLSLEAVNARARSSNLFIFFLVLVLMALVITLWMGYRLIKDATIQQRLERRLHEERELLLEAEGIAHFGSWLLDLDNNNRLYWSDGVYRIFGLPPQQTEATYEKFLDHVHPDDRDYVEGMYRNSIEQRECYYEMEYRILLSNGKVRALHEICRHFSETNNQSIRLVGVVRDITQQKEAESLKQQIKVTEEANQMKDEFLASMSHELRTPLTSIIGNSEYLLDQEYDSEIQSVLRDIEMAGLSQLALVNDILDISKIESGKFSIDEAPYSFGELLYDIERMFLLRAQDAGITLRIKQDNEEPNKLIGDRQRIAQILINLVGNAIKFTEHGGVTLTTTVDDGKIVFRIEDTGIGMSPKMLSRLFKRFEQADSSISRRFGGSGRGLYISHNLAWLMEGTIEVSSIEDVGSVFLLKLPYHPSNIPDNTRNSVPSKANKSQELFSGNVLIAEDTAMLQLLERRIFEQLGLTVTFANNGKEAVDLVAARPFDLIFMDMQMPVMDGIEACRQLRDQGNQIPIIALTANVMQKHRDQFRAVGCNEFLDKPISKQKLIALLQQYLSSPNKESVPPTAYAEVDDELMTVGIPAIVTADSGGS